MPFGLAVDPRVSLHILNPCCSFVNARAFMLLYIWMIYWPWVTLCMWTRGHNLFCVLSFLGLDINLSKSELSLTQQVCFLRLFGIQWMCLSLPSHKPLQIQQLSHWLLQIQPVTVCQVVSFLGKTNFCASGDAQLCLFCSVIQCDMFNVYHSPAHLFCSFCIFFPVLHQLQRLSQSQQSGFLAVSTSWCGYCCKCYFWSLGIIFSLVWVTFILYWTWSTSMHTGTSDFLFVW